MTEKSKYAKLRFWSFILFAVLSATLILLRITIPANASEEYIYTIQIIFKIAILPSLFFTFLLLFFISGAARFRWLFFWLALVLFAIPAAMPFYETIGWKLNYALSVCWLAGFMCMAIALFGIATRVGDLMAGILCVFASIFLFLGIGEGLFLFTDQGLADGYQRDTENSKYVLSGQAQEKTPHVDTPRGKFLKQPDHPSSSYAHRDLYYDRVLYDVRYTLNERGHRITPEANSEPMADVLTFGCSYTFGFGLENEQTWPWQLAIDLGPEWRVENYASNAFGAQQMLDLLETGAIAPPTAPHRFALYLGIDHHMIRQTGLFPYNSSAYVLEDGKLVRKGLTDDLPIAIVHKIPHVLNGSQLARSLVAMFVKAMEMANRDKYAAVYVAMVEKAATILRDKYNTSLTVLIWPDLEVVEPLLDKANIPWLELKQFLPEFGETGSAYHVLANVERHPNAHADDVLAKALAEWLKRKLKTSSAS